MTRYDKLKSLSTVEPYPCMVHLLVCQNPTQRTRAVPSGAHAGLCEVKDDSQVLGGGDILEMLKGCSTLGSQHLRERG